MLRILVASLLVAGSFVLTSQTASAEGPNAVSIELLGRGLLYSIDYDREISEEISVGGGFSSWGVSATYSDGTNYAAAQIIIIPLYLNYYLYNSNGNRWFITGGLDIISASFKSDSFTFSGSGAALTAGGGYEYRAQNGFLFRGAIYAILGGGGAVWPGFTLGYTF